MIFDNKQWLLTIEMNILSLRHNISFYWSYPVANPQEIPITAFEYISLVTTIQNFSSRWHQKCQCHVWRPTGQAEPHFRLPPPPVTPPPLPPPASRLRLLAPALAPLWQDSSADRATVEQPGQPGRIAHQHRCQPNNKAVRQTRYFPQRGIG